jgi:O-antigen/teichoic acid export membrane protein
MARGTGVALVGGLLGSTAGWLGQLLLARLLGPGGFGSYSIGLAIVGIASQLSTIGLSSAAIYFVARYAQEDTAKARDVLVQSIAASLFTGLAAGAALYLLSPTVATHFFHRPDLTSLLRVFSLTIGFAAGYKVATAATTVSYKLSYKAYLDLFSNGSFLLFFLIFYLLGGRLGGAAAAFLVSTVLGFGASAYSLVRLFPKFFAASSRASLVLRELLVYSMPAFAASLFWVPRTWMDRILLGYFRSPAEVGLYQAASQSVSLLYVASFAVSSIAGPMIANLYNRGERARLQDTYRVSTKWILYSTLIVFAAVAAGPRDVLQMFFGPKYQEATGPLLILTVAAVTDGADGTARSMLLLTGHQKVLMRISAVGLIVQFGLDLFLIPRYGGTGAAMAEVLVSVVLGASMLLGVKRFLGMLPYDGRYLKGLLATLLTAAGLYLIGTLGISILAIRVALRGGIAIAIFAAIMLAAGLDPEDRQVVAALLERYFRRGRDT